MHWTHRIFLSALLFASSAAILCFAAGCFADSACFATEPAKPIVFPVTLSYNLDKDKVTLPADLGGAVNLLVLSYSPAQQADAQSWLPVAKSIAASRSDFRFYMLPVFWRQNILYRLWMNYSMRSESPTAESWPWTIPLYVNKERFNQELEIPSESDVVVLLVDKAGKVLWRSTGALTDEKKAALMVVLGPASAKAPGTR